MNKSQWLIVTMVLLGIAPSMLFAEDASQNETAKTTTAAQQVAAPSCKDANAKAEKASNAVPPCQVQLDLVVACVVDNEQTQSHLAIFRKWAELNTEAHHPYVFPAKCHMHLDLLRQLQDRNLAKIVSEPRLVTLSGQTACFISGGEQAVLRTDEKKATLEYVPFGTRIELLPVVMPDHKIALSLEVEISSVQPELSVEAEGSRIPGRQVQRVKTSLTLEDGQPNAFVMAQRCEQSSHLLSSCADWMPACLATLLHPPTREDLIVVVTPHVVVPIASSSGSSSDDAKLKAEVKWARRVVADFLQAATNGPSESAWALLAPELAQQFNEKEGARFNNIGCYSNPKITAEEVAPNGNEIIFSGSLTSRRDWTPDANFTMRVVREPKDDRWGIRYVRIDDRLDNPLDNEQLTTLLGKKVTLVGIAQDAKTAATLRVGESVIYLQGLDCWPENLRDKKVRVVGKLVEKKLIPDADTDKRGAVSQGACGKQMVIENAHWQEWE